MKKPVTRIRDHVRSDFSPAYYGAVAGLLAVSIIINYAIGLENDVIDAHTGEWVRVVYYFLLYTTGYYLTCLLVSRFNQTYTYWRSRTFWSLSLFGLLVLSLDRGFPYLHDLASIFDQSYEGYLWIFRTSNHIAGFFLVLIPLWMYYQTADRVRSGFYGLAHAGDIKPYGYLLAMVAPLIVTASFHPSFSSYYPVYKETTVAAGWGWPAYLPAVIFEFVYGFDFLNVELLFRGFFVIGLAQVLGKDAILPMVTIYCYLHFGKPVGETISSIFGGYLLGIIALQTRSIWGGVLIHVGVAWLMEASAYLQKLI